MLTGKQRAYLRSLSNPMKTVLTVGKGGVNPDVVRQADEALAARELIKGRTLRNSPVAPAEAAGQTARETSAEVVQVTGSRFVLYRKNPKDPKISLPKRGKK